MGKVKRKVTVHPDDGESMTAHEIMVACAQVPSDLKPRVFITWKGLVKSMEFEVEVIPDGD